MQRMNQNKKRAKKDEYIEIRVLAAEKQGFVLASDLAGVSLSSWIRERLRIAAIRELESAGRRAPFVPDIPLGAMNARP
jgi:predicted Zn-dependent protease